MSSEDRAEQKFCCPNRKKFWHRVAEWIFNHA